MSDIVRSVQAATVRGELPAPVVFGGWVMRDREYVVVRVLLEDGTEGWSFTLTRDGAVAEQIERTVGPAYVGTPVSAREVTWRTAWRRSLASHAGGIGLRALSVVDLAMWDAAARGAGLPIAELLGRRATSLPATAVIGYPPALQSAASVQAQVAELSLAGWARFKLPFSVSADETVSRLNAAREAAPAGWLGSDFAWVFDSVDDALALTHRLVDLELGWVEDIFPPGDAWQLSDFRQRARVPVAMGDEQGGSYYPSALLEADAVDVVRIDLTCMGGITGGRRIVDECLAAGVEFAPHMFAHVHSQVFAGWGFDVPIEWGVPWTGVDPYADSLEQPIVEDGRMHPLVQSPGFGNLVNRTWLATQEVRDPDGILGLSPGSGA